MKKLLKVLSIFAFIFVLASCSNNQDVDNKGNNNETIGKITILFDGNGGILVSGEESQKVEKAADIIPPVYEKEGHTFKGWSVDLDTIITDNIVKAEWEEIIIDKVVTFDPNCGILSCEEKQNVKNGKQISIPSDPTRIGYTFDGWYFGSEKWDFASNIVTIDLTLTAHWIINQYTLTIKNYYGEEDLIVTQDYNSALSVNDPTRTGYSFDKFSETIPTNMPAEDKTIEASWICDVKYSIVNNEVIIIGTNNKNNNIIILEEYENYPTTTIGDEAFYNSTNITSLTLPDSVICIGHHAFYNCVALTSIKMSNEVITIDRDAFNNCTSLTSIIIPASVTYIGNGTFYCCASLTIYCEVSSKPSGWHDDWNYSNRPIVWEYTAN